MKKTFTAFTFTSVVCIVLLIDLCNGNFLAFADDFTSKPPSKETMLFERIQKHAKDIEVLPITMWAPSNFNPNFGRNPSTETMQVQERHELTFKRFIPLYSLKEDVYKASFEDIKRCIVKLDEASPKEKALIMAAIYIYERIHRMSPTFVVIEPKKTESVELWLQTKTGKSILTSKDKPCYVVYPTMYQGDAPPVYPEFHLIEGITNEEWKEMIDAIRKYKDSKEIAFPAFVGNKEEIRTTWKTNLEVCRQKLRDLDCPDTVSLGSKDKLIDKANMLGESEAGRQVRMLHEYFFLIDDYGLTAYKGFIAMSGNSSEKPKNLGDIATQLLKARLPYEDEK